MQNLYKDDYSITKVYRPIALLNIIGKVLESILAKKISVLIELYSLLIKTHFGSHRSISTKHTLYYLVEKIY